MPKVEDLFGAIRDMLDEVDLYFHQVRDLKYDNTFLEFETSKGKRNYDKIIRILKSVTLPDPDELITKTMELDELKAYLGELLSIILGDEFKDDISIAKSFVTAKTYPIPTDVKTSYKDIAGIETACEFIVSKKHNPIQLVQIVNSEITVLLNPLYRVFNETISNIHYKRFPGVLASYMAIYELSTILKQESIIKDFEDHYIYLDSEYSKEHGKEIAEQLPKNRKNEVLEHSEHNTFGYILSDIYSTNLIEMYLTDKKSFLEKYKSMLKGNMSIPEYFNYYGLDLRNREVIEKYQNKITEVEKRYQLK